MVAAPVFVLAMAPAIALFAMVAHRVMPGEQRLVAFLGRFAPRHRRITSTPARYDVIVVRRVGRLFAAALAMRPPPAPLLVSSYTIAMWTAVVGVLFLPANGTQIAAAEADKTGTTTLGKRVIDHSFQLPLQIAWISTALVGIAIVAVFGM